MLGIYGSPRAGGNSDRLLGAVLEGAEQAGAAVERLYLRELDYQGCIACGGCEKSGECVLKDDMAGVYPMLARHCAIVLAMPIFFYGPPAKVKAFMDRAQAPWCARANAKPKEEWGRHLHGCGYILGVGATKGQQLFAPTELMAKYFYDALDMDYGGGLFFRNLDLKDAVLGKPEFLQNARQWGAHLAQTVEQAHSALACACLNCGKK